MRPRPAAFKQSGLVFLLTIMMMSVPLHAQKKENGRNIEAGIITKTIGVAGPMMVERLLGSVSAINDTLVVLKDNKGNEVKLDSKWINFHGLFVPEGATLYSNGEENYYWLGRMRE